MAFLSSMNIIGSGLTAQQARLDVISENITNMNTTRTEAGGAYRRKVTVLESVANKDGFRAALSRAAVRGHTMANRNAIPYRRYDTMGGVRVAEIQEDPSELPFIYDPTHPDANEEGYLEMPNVTLVKEVTDAMAASQAYSADVTAFNALKQVISKAMEIGR